jgi:N-acetylmuramoyl-L-alanine amidase
MNRGSCRWLLLALAVLMAGEVPAAELKGLRLADEDGRTRAVFDLSGPAEYTLFGLAAPDRLVLDVKNGRLGADFDAGAVAGVVRGVRTGKLGKSDLRVVFDLHAKVKPASFILAPEADHGHRLVVDLQQNAAAAAAAPTKTAATAVQDTQRKVVIAIDAGHGGQDPGALGPSGTREKNLTLEMARELARQIDAEPGMQAFLVRDGDYFIPLQERYRKAREAQADLFISLHADAFHKPTPAGASVYMLSQRGASSEAARWLANSENAADLVGGVKLDDKDNTLAAVLLDLAQSASLKASGDVANSVLSGLKRVGKTHKQQVERANFVVLRSPDVPSILVETGFISNPGDEKKLKDPDYRRRLAAAIADGVRHYFHVQPPPGTWLAANVSGQPREHVVSRGETLSQIAARHGVPLSSLRSANRIRGDMLRVGERLRIPGAMGPG